MKSRLEVNLYKPLDVEKREIFSVFISKKEEERKMYLNDLVPYAQETIWYPKHYDQTDLILDLNFYNTLYDRYNNLREKSLSGWCSTNA
ncbi:hypothetical protein H5410_002295 [Solanum commersonii]|uniref:Uncharacterized protein n=1 Tax=Solanum commersonii TaxID=4109 RepID=A0A9J6B1Y3_SOLCO|nr:hypothetical protein H5410_002295 [Solanum commersonii]